MTFVGFDLEELAPPLVVEVQYQLGVAEVGFVGGYILHTVLFPQTVAVAEGTDAALGTDARACQYDYFLFHGLRMIWVYYRGVLFFDDSKHGAAVLSTAVGGAVVGHGLGLAVAFIAETTGGDAVLHQIVVNGFGPLFGQFLVGGSVAHIVGVSAKLDAQGGVVLHHLHNLVQFHDRDVQECVFAGLEENIFKCDALANFQFGGNLCDFFFVHYRFALHLLGEGERIEVEAALTAELVA